MHKLTALIAALALALAAPAASVAEPGKDKKPCPTVGKGHAWAKGHAKQVNYQKGKGKKCGHRPPTDGGGGTPVDEGGTPVGE